MVSAVVIACAVIAFSSPAGAAFFQLLGTNKACQRGIIKKSVKSLEECKGRCAALSACNYLGWDQISEKECVHYYAATCQRRKLSGQNRLFNLFKKAAFMPKTGSQLKNAVRGTSCKSPEPLRSIKIETITEGDGKKFPKPGQTVVVHYVGKLSNGKKYDSSRDRIQPFMFKVGAGEVIRGWDEGVMKMSQGQRAILHIPASMGYGATGAGDKVPPNSDLILDVDLIYVDFHEFRGERSGE